jgi:hypothetical protein
MKIEQADAKETPPERRRAVKGSAGAGRMSGNHTAASLSALEALAARKRVNESRAQRLALIVANLLPDGHPLWKKAEALEHATEDPT